MTRLLTTSRPGRLTARSLIVVALVPACALAMSTSRSLARKPDPVAKHDAPGPLRARVPAIIGGSPATPGSWPWLAFVHYALGNGNAGWCTGTVVAPNLILTAAHCVENTPSGAVDRAGGFTVTTGSIDRTLVATRQVSSVTRILPHVTRTRLRHRTVIGDAALLVLSTPTTAPPVTLADASDLALIQRGAQVATAGWGRTDPNVTPPPAILQQASLVVAGQRYCSSIDPHFDPVAQLCAIDAPAHAVTTCNGDSGGPLMARSSTGMWIQVGITSTGAAGCDPTLPVYFTRVDYVGPWLRRWIDATPPPAPGTQ